MKASKWEVIILKPTAVFQTFIEAQCPNIEPPDFKLLQTDCTAYAIPKHTNDEDILNTIESHYKLMFHHEMSRWLGDEVEHEIKGSFLDFLCCFKFEMHNQLVLLEKDFKEGQQVFCVRPRSVLLKWMKSLSEESTELCEVLEQVNVSQLSENATVVIKNFKQSSEVKSFVESFYPEIFEVEMSRMCDKAQQWPAVSSYQDFSRYFTVDIHTQLVHLN